MKAALRPRALLALCAMGLFLAACASKETTRTNVGGAGMEGGSGELKTVSDQALKDKRASIRLELAISYYQKGSYDIALDEVKQAIVVDPELADAYSVRALIYTAMDEMKLAEDSYQRAMRLAPRNPEFNNNYGSFLCQTGRHAQGIAQFEVALKNNKYQSPVKALINAGACSIQMKDYATAERYLLDALRYDGDQLSTNANLAKVYYERRDYPRAGFFINRVKALAKLDTFSAELLWLAIRIERKVGEKGAEVGMVTQLSRRFATSPEYAAFQRGAFDE